MTQKIDPTSSWRQYDVIFGMTSPATLENLENQILAVTKDWKVVENCQFSRFSRVSKLFFPKCWNQPRQTIHWPKCHRKISQFHWKNTQHFAAQHNPGSFKMAENAHFLPKSVILRVWVSQF